MNEQARKALTAAWALCGDQLESRRLGGQGVDNNYTREVRDELKAALDAWPEPLAPPIRDEVLAEMVVTIDNLLRLLGLALHRVELMRDGISYSAQRPVDDTAKLAEEIREILTASGKPPWWYGGTATN